MPQANAAMPTGDPAPRLYQTHNGKTAVTKMRNERMAEINARINALDDENRGNSRMRIASAGDFEPDFSFGPTTGFGDIYGPNGEMWFYSMETVQEPIEYEFFTDYKLVSFTVTIYNADHQPVGTVSDKIHYINDEWRAPMCQLLPSVTKSFFNDDDKCEIVMDIAVNTHKNQPGVRFYSLAYQIGGEKDAEGNDKIIYEFPGPISDVLSVNRPGQPDEVYMTLTQDITPSEIPDDEKDLWEYRLNCKNRHTIYGAADADGKLREVIVKEIGLQNFPGNQDTSQQIITFTEGGKAYAMIQEYGEPLYNPFYGSTDEITQRENNTLEIYIYDLADGTVFQHTSIPFSQSAEDKAVGLLNMYSVGDCTYRSDINFHDYSETGKASFIITKNDTKISSGNTESLSYYVYDSEGKRKATIYEDALNVLTMADVTGCEPMCMFVTLADDQYAFNFVGLHSFKKTATIYQYLEADGSDPEPLLANVDRVACGDSYRYVFEMRYPSEENDVSYMRIAHFNADGTFSHIDEVNMGESVHYAKCLISGLVLAPETFLSDSTPEYAMLIKRGTESGNDEEFLIGQACSDEYPEGRDVLHLGPCDKGVLSSILPYMDEHPMLGIAYTGNGYTVDFYNLPLDSNNSGIDTVPGTKDDDIITIEADSVCAQGCTVVLYSIEGIQLAASADRLNISAYPAGIYIVKAGDSTRKIIRK